MLLLPSRTRPSDSPTPASPTSSSRPTCPTCHPACSAYDLESGVEVDSTSQLRALRSDQDMERAKEEFDAEHADDAGQADDAGHHKDAGHEKDGD